MRTKPFLLTFLLVALVLPSVHAIGVTGCGARYVDYEPYSEVSFAHTVINAPNGYRVGVSGTWAEFTEIENQEGIQVSGTLTMPPNWDRPGTMRTYVVFSEVASPELQGTAIALTRIQCPIYVRVPYPGEYLEFDVNVRNINENELANAKYLVASRGDNPVDDARVTIDVTKNGTNYAKYSEKLRRIEPKQEIEETAQLATSELDPGVYSVIGTLTYADERIEVTREMRVGELDVAIINHSKRLPADDFTRLNFTVENRWNNAVDEVWITYRISNGEQTFPRITTETFSLKPFETKRIRSIAETPSVLEGVAFIEYTILFDGNERSGTLPVAFEAEGPDYRILIFVLLGILITVMIIIAVIIVRRNGRKQDKRTKKGKKR